MSAPALVRVNPGIDAGTHAKITTGTSDSRFGVPLAEALAVCERLSRLLAQGRGRRARGSVRRLAFNALR